METGELAVAQEILRQIPIGVKMACGARDFVGDTDRVHFRVTITPRKFHKVEIILTPLDLYEVNLWLINLRTGECEIVKTVEFVYADSLGEVVYSLCNR